MIWVYIAGIPHWPYDAVESLRFWDLNKSFLTGFSMHTVELMKILTRFIISVIVKTGIVKYFYVWSLNGMFRHGVSICVFTLLKCRKMSCKDDDFRIVQNIVLY